MNQEQLREAVCQALKHCDAADPKVTIFMGRDDYFEVCRDAGLAANLRQVHRNAPLELYGHPVYTVTIPRYLKVIAE